MLVDDCLKLICAEPQQCLRFFDEDEEESYCRQVLSGSSTVRSGPFCVVPAQNCPWKDPWTMVRDECVQAARSGEARGQVVSALAASGRLMDGSLPKDFWVGLKTDCLSLAGSRVGRGTLGHVAVAKLPLVSLDLGGCLLVDDDSVREITQSCRDSLRRLGLRNCRKLTDESVKNVAQLPKLAELDIGGDFNITSEGIREHLLSKKSKQTLVGLGASGLDADDSLLSALSATTFVRLGLGYGSFTSYKFVQSVFSWPNLQDLRVQWTKTFDVSSDARAALYPPYYSPRTRRMPRSRPSAELAQISKLWM